MKNTHTSWVAEMWEILDVEQAVDNHTRKELSLKDVT